MAQGMTEALIAEGTKITVILSLGKETEVILMEELRGGNIEDVLRFLEGQGMNPLPFEEFSDEYAVGQVIRTNPVAGTPLTEGQKVEVYYSAGPAIQKEKMPDVVGLNYSTAMKRLDDLGFDMVVEEGIDYGLTFDEEPELQVLNGRFGPYIAYKGSNYKLPKTVTPAELSLQECLEIVNKQQEGGKAPAKRRYTKKK